MNVLHDAPGLSHREQQVLQLIIQNFIVSASPVGSKALAARHNLNVSAATIRSDMNNLENKGYLDHPHTSAGRIPTDLGYRFYVNWLMKTRQLPVQEQQALDAIRLSIDAGDMDEAVYSGARLLSRLSNLLSVTIAPKLADGVFQKMEMVSVSSTRLMVILTIESGVIRTVSMEVDSELSRDELDRVSQILNERLSGQILSEIKLRIREMLADFSEQDSTGLIRIFMDRADAIFDEQRIRKFHFGGVEYMALQPEFSDLKHYQSIIEVVEQEDLIVHLFGQDSDELSNDSSPRKVKITIGSENTLQQMEQCSVVSANYKIGNATGTIGLVGPTRMDYSRMVSLVEQLAARFNKPSSHS